MQENFESRGIDHAAYLLLFGFKKTRDGFGERMNIDVEAGRIATMHRYKRKASLSSTTLTIGVTVGEVYQVIEQELSLKYGSLAHMELFCIQKKGAPNHYGSLVERPAR